MSGLALWPSRRLYDQSLPWKSGVSKSDATGIAAGAYVGGLTSDFGYYDALLDGCIPFSPAGFETFQYWYAQCGRPTPWNGVDTAAKINADAYTAAAFTATRLGDSFIDAEKPPLYILEYFQNLIFGPPRENPIIRRIRASNSLGAWVPPAGGEALPPIPVADLGAYGNQVANPTPADALVALEYFANLAWRDSVTANPALLSSQPSMPYPGVPLDQRIALSNGNILGTTTNVTVHDVTIDTTTNLLTDNGVAPYVGANTLNTAAPVTTQNAGVANGGSPPIGSASVAVTPIPGGIAADAVQPLVSPSAQPILSGVSNNTLLIVAAVVVGYILLQKGK
jgi:hypothetical protein